MTPGTYIKSFLVKGIAFDYEDGDPSIAVTCLSCGDEATFMTHVLRKPTFVCPVCRGVPGQRKVPRPQPQVTSINY